MVTKKLEFDFFARKTQLVAQELLGKVMVFQSPCGPLSGIVVEDEAYLGWNDPGSHSFRGKTKRNAVMFGPAGVSYIYLIYGMYGCYNVTTDREEVPAAVLIRALQPLAGIDLMKKNRGREKLTDLCSGPGKLVKALGIPLSMNGVSAITGPVSFYDRGLAEDFTYCQTTRVGLSQGSELPLRFYIEHNPHVSRK